MLVCGDALKSVRPVSTIQSFGEITMTYQNAIEYIESTLRFGSKPGLLRIRELLEKMGNPQDSLKFIHVAGTNGKGSVSNAVSAALREGGLKTGLFISPYISDFCERMQINGENISHTDLADEVENIKPYAESLKEHPTEFELITAVALNYFKRNNCDVVVLEVGLGGRFDATNIIKKPLVSVITSISLDHMNILGNTIRQIAFEKCGIIKPGGITVTCPNQSSEALEVIMSECARLNNTLIMPSLSAAEILDENIFGTHISYGKTDMRIPLAGRHQIANFLTAFETVKVLSAQGFCVPDAAIANAFSKVRFPARMEILNHSPLIVIDGAHNRGGASALSDSIKRYFCEKPVLMIGMLKDKEFEEFIKTVVPLAASVIAVTPENPRALSEHTLAEVAKQFCGSVVCGGDYPSAVRIAVSRCGGAPIVICGSLYIAGKMRTAVNEFFNYSNSIKDCNS